MTKRGKCAGVNSKISWTQVETGSAITWKYPSVILQGDNSVGEFYSVAVVNNQQQADTGTKMIHIGKNTKSDIVSKGISAGHGNNSYRGQVKILPQGRSARNYTQCDSMLIGNECGAHTFPYIEVQNNTATLEHEASTSKIGEDQIFYCKQRGLSAEHAVSMIVCGFCREVFQGAADGVCSGSAAAARDYARRKRRLMLNGPMPTAQSQRQKPRGLDVAALGQNARISIHSQLDALQSVRVRGPNNIQSTGFVLEINDLHASIGERGNSEGNRPAVSTPAKCTR